MVLETVIARLAESAERKALNLVVVGSSPTVGGYAKLQAAEQSKWVAMINISGTWTTRHPYTLLCASCYG